jgi:hypothetical protein
MDFDLNEYIREASYCHTRLRFLAEDMTKTHSSIVVVDPNDFISRFVNNIHAVKQYSGIIQFVGSSRDYPIFEGYCFTASDEDNQYLTFRVLYATPHKVSEFLSNVGHGHYRNLLVSVFKTHLESVFSDLDIKQGHDTPSHGG